ncbi:hypothetical protein HMI55_005983 [Coelomomyces lativittatus]|nr:hypothetical protein HMI55_005983 [Coelomomyces lativittatus]
MGFTPCNLKTKPLPQPTPSGFLFTTYQYVQQKIKMYDPLKTSNLHASVSSFPSLRHVNQQLRAWYQRKFGSETQL